MWESRAGDLREPSQHGGEKKAERHPVDHLPSKEYLDIGRRKLETGADEGRCQPSHYGPFTAETVGDEPGGKACNTSS